MGIELQIANTLRIAKEDLEGARASWPLEGKHSGAGLPSTLVADL
jgi:hypothetical protein